MHHCMKRGQKGQEGSLQIPGYPEIEESIDDTFWTPSCGSHHIVTLFIGRAEIHGIDGLGVTREWL